MNILHARKLIHKIEALLQTIDSGEKVSALEKDLLKSYVLDLYKQLFDSDSASPQAQETTQKTAPATSGSFKPETPRNEPMIEKQEPAVPEPAEVKTPSREMPETSVKTEKELPQPEPVKSTLQPPAEPLETDTSQPGFQQPPTPGGIEGSNGKSRANDGEKLEALFATPKAQELSDRLSERPLPKIEAGMGINERILTINELFGSDQKVFEKTLSDLNAMDSFQEAKAYLIEHIAPAYNWDDDKNFKKAAQFIRLVRRKYNANA